MNILNLTSENFDKEVLQSDKTVLVDFWASWCMPCKMMSGIVEEIANEMEGKVKVGKVNIDEEPQIAEAEKIEIIPTLVLYRDGKSIDSIVAPESKIMIENFINEALEK